MKSKALPDTMEYQVYIDLEHSVLLHHASFEMQQAKCKIIIENSAHKFSLHQRIYRGGRTITHKFVM